MILQSAKPGTPGPTPEQGAKQAFVAQVRPQLGTKKKARLVSHSGDDERGQWVKVLGYSFSGGGKTYLIVFLLRCGFRVLYASTDFGGSGISTVRNELKRTNEVHLLKNLRHVDVPDYDTMYELARNPADVLDFNPYEWDNDDKPFCFVWDGYTGFQQFQLSEKVSSIDPLSEDKASAGRNEGLWFDRSDWGMIRIGSLRPLSWFLLQHNRLTGKLWHKYVTALENKPSEDKLTGKMQKAPLIQGAAGSIIPAAFDIILEMRAKSLPSGETLYTYGCAGNEKILAKSRGYGLAPEEPADFGKIWTEKIAPGLGGGAQFNESAKMAPDERIPDVEPEKVEHPLES
ncbi:MAG: hypothetical protein ABFD89_03570 [Bryobacteraceae bacterium]